MKGFPPRGESLSPGAFRWGSTPFQRPFPGPLCRRPPTAALPNSLARYPETRKCGFAAALVGSDLFPPAMCLGHQNSRGVPEAGNFAAVCHQPQLTRPYL